ncbi:MAG: Mov34/MPN/PAD-1 family protein [Caulobacter sp.]|nr:Mov34/MPN/PAD-1 family protein [Caulobacter sp.]
MKVWLTNSLMARIREMGQAFYPLETGGILLGWRDNKDRIASVVIGPGPQALHGRHMFLPDHKWQVARIRELFKESGGDLDYLGDWHTHPGGTAEMSQQDHRTLARLSRRVDGVVMVIAAGHGNHWEFGAWSKLRRTLFGTAPTFGCELKPFDAPADWPQPPNESD